MDMDFDLVVAGGGIAGLVATAAFGRAGYSVLCIDPMPDPLCGGSEKTDLRTTALLQPSRNFLEKIGLWRNLEPHAAKLQIMRIIDAGGENPTPRVTREFNSADVSENPFGWNIPNWLLKREIARKISQCQNASMHFGLSAKALFCRKDSAKVVLSNGASVRCKMAIAADGRNSPMRQAAGIDVKTMRYGQKALAFTVTHPIPHCNVSTEIHRWGGPFTMVPLPDNNGSSASAVIWMETGPVANRLSRLSDIEFEAKMNERSCMLLGPLELTSRRTVWPIISQYAHRLASQRMALVAEVAHVVPPIGAQGLNMSMADMATLLELAEESPDCLGEEKMLEDYHGKRHLDVVARVVGIDLLNRISMAKARPIRDMRALGLNIIHELSPVRKALMKLGMGFKTKKALKSF